MADGLMRQNHGSVRVIRREDMHLFPPFRLLLRLWPLTVSGERYYEHSAGNGGMIAGHTRSMATRQNRFATGRQGALVAMADAITSKRIALPSMPPIPNCRKSNDSLGSTT